MHRRSHATGLLTSGGVSRKEESMASRARAPHNPRTQTQPEGLPLEERIRQRAHEIYLERGGEDGSEMEDWLQAEQEILGQEKATAR